MKIILLLILISVIYSCNKKNTYEHKIEIITVAPLGISAISDMPNDILSLSDSPYLCGDSTMIIPLVEILKINDLSNRFKLTKSISKSFSGDPNNFVRATRKLKEQISKVSLEKFFVDSIEFENQYLINKYSEIINNVNDNNKFYVYSPNEVFIDSFINDKLFIYHDFNILKNNIVKDLCGNHLKNTTILYKPYLKINVIKEPDPSELFTENELAIEKNNKSKLIEIGNIIESKLENMPFDWRLWYAHGINRITIGGNKYLDSGLESLKNAAKEAIDIDESEELLRYLEKKESYILDKFKTSKKPRHPYAIYDALRRKEKCLLDVVTETVIVENWHSIGKNCINLIPIGYYNNSFWGFRITAKEKLIDGSIIVDIFVPNNENTNEFLDTKIRLGQEFKTTYNQERIARKAGKPNMSWDLVFINESPLDCVNIKIRYDMNEKQIDPTN